MQPESIAEGVVTGVVLLIMLRSFAPGRNLLLQWGMFTTGCFINIELRCSDKNGAITRIRPESLRRNGSFEMTPQELQMIVKFLKQSFSEIDGEGVITWSGGEGEIKVQAAHVVV